MTKNDLLYSTGNHTQYFVIAYKGKESIYLFIFCLFAISWAVPAAYGGSQARGQIGAVVASLHHSHSHSHAASELRLRPTQQLMATPDP